MKQKLQHLSKILLIVLFVSYYGETTLFLHTHQTAYGLVTHSHPYKTGHTHSQVELETLHQLSLILFVLSAALTLSCVKVFFRFLLSKKDYHSIPLALISNPLRGPPFFA